jgi:PAS domain S-box-containing protein
MVNPMENALAGDRRVAADAQTDPFDEIPVAYVEVDARGVITRANRAARNFHSGWEEAMVGRSVFDFSPAEEVDADREAFFAMLEAGEEPPVVRRTLYRDSGGFRIIELHRSLIRDAEGRPAGVRSVSIDVSETQMAHEEDRRARLWLESIVESISEAVMVTDALGFVRSMNPAAERLFGYEAKELIGKPIEKGLPILCFCDTSSAPPSFSMAMERPFRVLVTMRDHERQEMKVEISTSPILDKENGYTVGVVSVWSRVGDSA